MFIVSEGNNGVNPIVSGIAQNSVCDFVYPSSGITGIKYFQVYAGTGTSTKVSIDQRICNLYYFTTPSPSAYVLSSELEQVSADITATIPSTAGLASESYVQTNSAVLTGMIDGKQDTLTFGYDEQDRISAINNSAVAGGSNLVWSYVEV